MYPSQEITKLRKDGKLQQALEFGTKALNDAPDNFYLKSAMAWVYFDVVKRDVNRLKPRLEKGHLPENAFATLRDFSLRYIDLKLNTPDLTFSQITRQFTHIGKHLPFYVPFLRIHGIRSFSAEDREPYETEGGVAPALLTKVAREAMHWCVQQGSLDEESPFVFELVDAALSNTREAPSNLIWLYYDRAFLLARMGNVAAAETDMQFVLKSKRNEFWAWGRMAGIVRQRDLNQAIACLCKGLLCKAPPQFTVKLHISLANCLQQAGQTGQAVAEYLWVANIYEQQGWQFPKDLDAALQAPWFDPALPSEDREQFYKKHAKAVRFLLIEKQPAQDATYLGELMLNGQAKYLLALKDTQPARQVLVDWPDSEIDVPMPGTPLHVQLGKDRSREILLNVNIRPLGNPWDCLTLKDGIIEHINRDRQTGAVCLGAELRAILRQPAVSQAESLKTGTPVRIGVSANPAKEGRLEAWTLEAIDNIPSLPGIKERTGTLQVKEKGFGFVDSVFVPAHMADPTLDGKTVRVLFTNSFDQVKQRAGFKAIALLEVA